MNAFVGLQNKANEHSAEVRAAAASKLENERRLDEMKRTAEIAALQETLKLIGIEAEVVTWEVTIDGFMFSLDAPRWLRKRGSRREETPTLADEAQLILFEDLCLTLIVTNTELKPAYMEKVWQNGKQASLAVGEISVPIDKPGLPRQPRNWGAIATEVLACIEFLRNEAAAAPARMEKYLLDKRKAEEERIEQERVRRERREQEEREEGAERERRRVAWEAVEANRAKQRAEREAQEAAWQAEVAAKIGISTEAFKYLVEQIADSVRVLLDEENE